jgi:hypothetical protein
LETLHARILENRGDVVETIDHAANEREAGRVVRGTPVTILFPPVVSIKKKEKVVCMASLPKENKNI